ncbi:MAG: diguanylate cyclase [Paracoccaceae bacterium]|nr:diguanylate cyclase [Paracoccaceae bacterium]
MTRAKVLSLFPLATITAYWLGNQAVLFAVSVILPIILAIQAFIRPNESTENNRLGDALTDLPQPKILVDLLSHTLENKQKTGLNTACIVVDIDGFTRLNTSLGQARGNDVLKRISDRIVAAVREEDVVVRLENDCFAIALDPVYKVDLESTLSVVRRIQKSVHDPMNLAGSSIAISISSGYCLGSGSPENTGESLVQAAKKCHERGSAKWRRRHSWIFQ